MEESKIKSRWIKFHAMRGPVWDLEELTQNEPPTGEVNDCGVLLEHAHIVIHDDPLNSLLIYLCKYEGYYYTGIEANEGDGGHSHYPGISDYHNRKKDKIEAVKEALRLEDRRKQMPDCVSKSIKEALAKLEDLKIKREPVQLLIEW